MPNNCEHVLVVDDDPDMCWGLEKLLRAKFYNVVTVGGGREALLRLKDATFDLIILDAKLPDISGFELAQLIRKETGVMTPIVLISGYLYSNDRAVQECLQSGLIAGFAAKPFFHDDFLEIVRMAL